MRITQSMLSNNMLRNLSSSYSKMGTLQNQLDSGKKITRPSQDPVVTIKGIGYRTDLAKIEQYQRNIGGVNNWLDSSDDALDHVGVALKRVQELVTSAANDTKTPDDREKIAKEIEQIQKQIQNFGNTRVGDKYIFSGTSTLSPLFNPDGTMVDGGQPTDPSQQDVSIEVYDGVSLVVNTKGYSMFKELDDMMQSLKSTLEDTNATGSQISTFLSRVNQQQDNFLVARSDIGARQNRVEMMGNRLDTQEVIVKKQMSDNEDIDYEKAITELITQESIHRAALSVGARIIQPTLTDFLR